MEDWIDLERENYEAGETLTKTYAGQEFDLFPLLQSAEDNPYTHGAAAFAVRDNWAISVELLCQDSFERDAQTCLIKFLSGFHDNDEQEAQ